MTQEFRPSSLPRLLAFGVLLLPFAAPARADLVVLTDGSVIKAAGFQADGDNAQVMFSNGGRMTMPIDRVDRVVDDEVIAYLNRLSDFLFLCARFENLLAGRGDVPWEPT